MIATTINKKVRTFVKKSKENDQHAFNCDKKYLSKVICGYTKANHS